MRQYYIIFLYKLTAIAVIFQDLQKLGSLVSLALGLQDLSMAGLFDYFVVLLETSYFAKGIKGSSIKIRDNECI